MAKVAKTADRKKVMDTTKSTDCPKCGKPTRVVKRVKDRERDIPGRHVHLVLGLRVLREAVVVAASTSKVRTTRKPHRLGAAFLLCEDYLPANCCTACNLGLNPLRGILPPLVVPYAALPHVVLHVRQRIAALGEFESHIRSVWVRLRCGRDGWIPA